MKHTIYDDIPRYTTDCSCWPADCMIVASGLKHGALCALVRHNCMLYS
jgi:hypothetical protein